MASDRLKLARDAYRAYESQDRELIDSLLADDFVFYSPPDPGIDRATKRFRNTEVLTFRGDQIAKVEVYFGWNL